MKAKDLADNFSKPFKASEGNQTRPYESLNNLRLENLRLDRKSSANPKIPDKKTLAITGQISQAADLSPFWIL